jgi:hypothetical protein
MIVALALTAFMAQTPVPQARDGVITGQVVDAASGKPVAAAVVSISGAVYSNTGLQVGGRIGLGPGAPLRVLTGSDGRFMFRELTAGSFLITVTKGGYADGASGRRVVGGPPLPVVLTAAQRTAETSIRMWKNAAITGTVVDESGEPVVALQVRALRRTFTGGRRRFAPYGPVATTDDRGLYRLSGLSPGDYLIAASPPTLSANTSAFVDARTGRGSGAELASILGPPGTANGVQVGNAQVMIGRGGAIPPPPIGGRMQVYPPIFYPSARLPAQATPIALASGEERLGVDLQLQPAATVRVSGSLMGPSGPPGMVPLRLIPAGVQEVASDAMAPASISDAAGSFTFAAVPQGLYSLRATARVGATGSGPGPDMFWLDMPLNVSGDDVDGVVAVMRTGLRITARLEFEGATPRPAAQPQRPGQFTPPPFSLESDDLSPTPMGTGSMAGTPGEQVFTLGGYAAGKYRVRVQGSPSGWMFKSAMLNGVDVSDTPFEFTRDISDLVLTFTDRWSGMGGTVQGAGAGGAMVLAFTTNPQAWENTGTVPRRLKSTRANAKGEFGLSSVPPGEYYVIAVPEEQAADWRDPKTLEALARQATQVSIAEGEHKMIDLRLKEVRQ